MYKRALVEKHRKPDFKSHKKSVYKKSRNLGLQKKSHK